MHKFILTIISTTLVTVFLGIFVYWGFSFNRGPTLSREVPEEVLAKESVFSELKKPRYYAPTKITLGNKDLVIEEIGLTYTGQLDVPSDWDKVGWFSQRSKPGEAGNLVLDGHFDTNTGVPAAFWSLKSSKIGDKLIVQDEVGREFTYEVTDTFYVDIQDPSRLSVLEESDDAKITLITCGGVWVPGTGYNKRLVVQGKLVLEAKQGL